jgi:hypothetical protein
MPDALAYATPAVANRFDDSSPARIGKLPLL